MFRFRLKCRMLGILFGICMCQTLAAAETMEEPVEQIIEEEPDVDLEEGSREIPGLGIRYVFTEEMEDSGLAIYRRDYVSSETPGIFCIGMEDVELYYILVYPEEEYQKETEHWVDRFQEEVPEVKGKEETNGEFHYSYLDLTGCIVPEDYEQEEWEEVEEILSLCREIVDSVEYMDLEKSRLTFDSLNLDGERVTDAIFGEKKITVLNVWATYCSPCINEMPELAAWEEEMGEDAQILYLCADVSSESDTGNLQLAEEIAEKSGINRKNVILNLPDTCTAAMAQIIGVPTTFFVDQDGKLLEEQVVGADVAKYKEILKKYLE